MSPESIVLEPSNQDKGVLYSVDALTLFLQKDRARWSITAFRGETVLGVGLVKLADAKQRQLFIRSLRGLEPDEDVFLDRVLIALSVRMEADWTAHEAWLRQTAIERRAEAAILAESISRASAAARLAELEPLVKPLLEDPALLYLIAKAIEAQGVVGECANGLLLYLSVTSQYGEVSISVYVKGDSSGGKSWLVKRVLLLFPRECHIDLTSMSEHALIYDEREYSHKTIVIYEMQGQGSEFTNYLIRTMITEGRITHLTTEKTSDGLKGKEIDKPGPTNFITTTTAPEGHAENETRVLTALVNDSPEVTREVLNHQALVAEGKVAYPDPSTWQALQEWLSLAGNHEVVVPFATNLAERIPDRPLRLRRDFSRLLLLLQVTAILHQRQRQRNADGKVVTTLADYAMTRALVKEMFARAVRGLTEKTTKLVDALEQILDEMERKGGKADEVQASYSDLVKRTGLPKYHISRWLKPALEAGLVDNTQTEKGKAAALKLGQYRLSDGDILPSVDTLVDALGEVCSWVDPLSGEQRLVFPHDREGEDGPEEPLHRCSVAEGDSTLFYSTPAAEQTPMPVRPSGRDSDASDDMASDPEFGEV